MHFSRQQKINVESIYTATYSAALVPVLLSFHTVLENIRLLLNCGIIKQTQLNFTSNLNNRLGLVHTESSLLLLNSVWQTRMTSCHNASKTGIFLLLQYIYVLINIGLFCYGLALAVLWKSPMSC